MTRTPPPRWLVAPDLYALTLREWIDALEMAALKYRRMKWN